MFEQRFEENLALKIHILMASFLVQLITYEDLGLSILEYYLFSMQFQQTLWYTNMWYKSCKLQNVLLLES